MTNSQSDHQVIAPENVHANLWVGANKKFRAVPSDRLEKARRQKDRSESELKRADERLAKKNAKRNAAIKAKGIDYEFDGYAK
jgi:nucleolar protein 15